MSSPKSPLTFINVIKTIAWFLWNVLIVIVALAGVNIIPSILGVESFYFISTILFFLWLLVFQILTIKKVRILTYFRDRWKIGFFPQFFLHYFLINTILFAANYTIALKTNWHDCTIKRCYSYTEQDSMHYMLEFTDHKDFSHEIPVDSETCKFGCTLQSLEMVGILGLPIEKKILRIARQDTARNVDHRLKYKEWWVEYSK